MKVATKIAIATLSTVLLLGSTGNVIVEATSSKSNQSTVANKKVKKAPTVAEIEYMESEIKKYTELAQESDDVYVMFNSVRKQVQYFVNSDLLGFTTYDDYVKRVSTFKGPKVKHPDNLPEGYEFVKARIELPFRGPFFDDLREQAKKSGKPVYTKKMDWKELDRAHLFYTNGTDELIINLYSVRPEYTMKKGFLFEHPYDKKKAKGPDPKTPKHMSWYESGNYYYSLSTMSDMTQEEMKEILKAAIEK